MLHATHARVMASAGASTGRRGRVLAGLVGVPVGHPGFGGDPDLAILDPKGHFQRRGPLAGEPATNLSGGGADLARQVGLRPLQLRQSGAKPIGGTLGDLGHV